MFLTGTGRRSVVDREPDSLVERKVVIVAVIFFHIGKLVYQRYRMIPEFQIRNKKIVFTQVLTTLPLQTDCSK